MGHGIIKTTALGYIPQTLESTMSESEFRVSTEYIQTTAVMRSGKVLKNLLNFLFLNLQ